MLNEGRNTHFDVYEYCVVQTRDEEAWRIVSANASFPGGECFVRCDDYSQC